MGNICQATPSDPADVKSSSIDQDLKKEKEKMHKEQRFILLLLGPGESGKSTILKQMKILAESGVDGGGFTEKDRNFYKPVIRSQIIQNSQILVEGATALSIPIDAKDKEYVQLLLNINESDFQTQIEYTKYIWNDKGIQEAFSRYRELSLHGYNLPDSAKYFFFDRIDRLLDPMTQLADEDVLRCRSKTTALVQHDFSYKQIAFKMLDVGGQKSERKKWLTLMSNLLDAVIFCAPLSEYDVNLREDFNKNRMEDTLTLFHTVCNHKYLQAVNVIFISK